MSTLNQIGQRTVTLQAIADATGVHVSTVSLALRNDPRAHVATRQRVQEAARRLGYRPNPSVALLMAQVRRRRVTGCGNLALVYTVSRAEFGEGNFAQSNYFRGAARRATELGYTLDKFFLSERPRAAAHLLQVLRSRNVTGLIVAHAMGPVCPERRLPLDVSEFAVVNVGVPLASPELHYVANDQYMRAIVAARELLALGYRRLGLVSSEFADRLMMHRCSAGFWAVQESTPDLPRLPICRIAPPDLDGFRAWFREHRPDAILCNCFATLAALRQLGARVPEEVGWLHLDWIPEFGRAAGIQGNSERVGAAAVDLLVSQLHRGERGPPGHPLSHLVAGSWVPGDTVRRMGPPLTLDCSIFAPVFRADGFATAR